MTPTQGIDVQFGENHNINIEVTSQLYGSNEITMVAHQSNTSPITHIHGSVFREMIMAALTWLHTNHQAVNALNVFPIPDSDTGTNMLLTMQAACDEAENSATDSVAEISHLLAHGALMGARGNSGVILSQYLRGIAKGLENFEKFTTNEFATAMLNGTETAYRGVVRPVEGTILTVMKDSSAAALSIKSNEYELPDFLQHVTEACKQSVERTPELLPVLEQAGVVDAGGFGLQIIFEGMLRHLHGEPLDAASAHNIKTLDLTRVHSALETTEPGQDWEVVLDLHPSDDFDLDSFYSTLDSMGTSIQVGEGDDILRLHIHLTEANRFKPIEYAETVGAVANVHMENLLYQLEQQALASEGHIEHQPGQILAVVVSPGTGFTRIFSAPAVAVISGGQSMNPSTQDFLSVFDNVPADQIIILPNDANILMTAEQAVSNGTREVCVIPTSTVPQGIAAMLHFDPDGAFDTVCNAMRAGANQVESGGITTATRSANINGCNVIAGQMVGLHNGEIACVGETPAECMLELLHVMGAEQFELVTLYHGEETDPTASETLRTSIETCFPQLEVESYPGGQPNYHYILSLE